MSRRPFGTLTRGALLVLFAGLAAWWATRGAVSARVEPSGAKLENATLPDASATDVALAMPSANRELESAAQNLDAESPIDDGDDAIAEYRRYANGGPPSDPSGRPERTLQGRVVDDRGQPMQGAEIVAAVRDRVVGEMDADIVMNRWDGHVFERLGVPDAESCSRASSNPDGTFTLEGVPIDGDIVLAATFGGSMSDLVAVGAGTGPVQITLPRDGSLFGRIEGGATLPFMDVRLRWWRTDDGRFGKQLAGEQKADDLFAIWFLAPGVYSVAVSSKDAQAETELARVDGVIVRSGDPTHDGRLDPLELRSRLRTVVVDVVGCDGQSIDGFRGWWCTTDGAFLTLPERLKGSRFTIAAPIAIPRDFAVYELGWRAVRLTMDVDRVQIVLPRPLALRATLGPEFSAAAQTAPITLLFASDEAWLMRAVDAVESVCDPLGRAEVRLPFAGKVAVRAWLRQPGEAEAHWVELSPVVVDEANPAATIELRSKPK